MENGPVRRGVIAGVLLVLAAGCEPRNDQLRELEQLPEPPTGEVEVERMDTPVLRAISTPALGDFLVDQRDRPLYVFDADSLGSSTCYGPCAEVWPPFLATVEQPLARLPAREELAGTVTRDDGAEQVTYAGWPLYFYTPDGALSATGHGVLDFGARWHLVTPDGTRVPGG